MGSAGKLRESRIRSVPDIGFQFDVLVAGTWPVVLKYVGSTKESFSRTLWNREYASLEQGFAIWTGANIISLYGFAVCWVSGVARVSEELE